MAAVSFRGAGKSFGDVTALADFDLEIGEGEFVVFVGPSGSGKTTSLRLLAGLERLTSGEIAIGERVVNDVPAADRDVAMVFQTFALYPHMTVRQNLEYGLRRRQMERSVIARRVAEAAALLEIAAYLDRYPSQLSGGQAQRVAVCRALVRDPAVLLMDEPLSSLDAKLRTYARAEIKRLQAETRTTTVFVTHDQVEAMTMGDRIAVMSAARLAQCGTPEDVYRRPANIFVAGFIGSPPMNLLAARPRLEDMAWRVDLDEGGSFVYARNGSENVIFDGGSARTVGFRPEDVTISHQSGGDWSSLVEGRVSFIEDLGRERFLHVRTGSGTNIVVAAPGWGNERAGDRVELSVRRSGFHFFGADGAALAHLGVTAQDRSRTVPAATAASGHLGTGAAAAL